MLAPSSAPSSTTVPGWRGACVVAVVVIAVHGWALEGFYAPRPAAPPVRATLVTRQVPTLETWPLIAERRVAMLQPGIAPLRKLRVVPHVAETPPAALTVALVETPAATVEAPAEAASAPEATSLTPLPDVPVYQTRLPTALTLRYELRRGPLTGQGSLSWRPNGRRYELVLDGNVAGLPVLRQQSTGQIDAAGIAPDRFTDQRLRRGTQAANFQRDRKLVSFSGSTAAFTLAPGMQDRLSWMLQLAGIVAAEPKRAKAGGQVSMVVVGVRGEADVWVFDFVAAEDIATARGTVHALRFVREPRKPYDSKVEVWLDPARQHIPAHARFVDGETLDLLLIAAEPPG